VTRLQSYSSEGIVLAVRDYGEADRIVIIFSKGFGKLTLLAKGVRKPSSRKRGHIEVFNQIKFSAVKGRGFDLITEAEIINSFRKLRKSLKKVAVSYYVIETIGKTTHDFEPNQSLYDLILSILTKIELTDDLKTTRINFVVDLLTTLGYWPKGKVLKDPDAKLQEVTERKIHTLRVGKRLLN